MTRLAGQVALVTGCARSNGLGRAIALALAGAGADVAVTDISRGGTRNDHEGRAMGPEWSGLDGVVAELTELGSRAIGLVGDVGVKADAERTVREVVDHYGRLDILVNNAGAPLGADRDWSWEVPEEAFDLVMRVNTKGVFLMSTAIARHFISQQSGGRIINIASDAGRRGFSKSATYCASKFAVIGLTQSMALELAAHGVTVNAICPGPIDTSRAASPSGEEFARHVPVGRIGTTDDIVNTVLFLANPDSSFITGVSLHVNGGFVLS